MKRFGLVVVLFCAGCLMPDPRGPRDTPIGPVDGGLPPFDPDAEPVPEVPERAACNRMCAHMQELHCPLGDPTPARHEPCVSWCTRIQSKHEVDLHLDCLAQVVDCDHVKVCDQRP